MGDRISQEEINALLSDASGEIGGIADSNAGAYDEIPPTSEELDVLGEVYNISMGSAATAVSSLLRMKVDITAPIVEVMDKDKLIYHSLEPALGVEIKYTVGINGSNIFILSQHDIMRIVDILLGGTGMVDESTEFNDMHVSAIGEVMNQMMGASSTALSGFINTLLDISIPHTYIIEGDFKYIPDDVLSDKVVVTRFKFIVGDIVNSEMITTSSIGFARELISKAKRFFNITSEDAVIDTTIKEPEAAANVSARQAEQAPAAEQPAPQSPNPNMQFDPAMMAQMQQMMMMMYPQMFAPAQQNAAPQNPPVSVQPVQFGNFDGNAPKPAYDGNMDLLLDLPLDLTVEIGRTRMSVQEVLDLGESSDIELDKQAAEPVDVIVNGHLIARGSVIMIEENFGVRITEIVSNQEKLKIARNNKLK